MDEKTFNYVWSLLGQNLISTFKDFPRPEVRIFSDSIELYFTFSGCLKSIPSVGDYFRIFAKGDDLVLVYTFIFFGFND